MSWREFYANPDLKDGFGSTAYPRKRPHGGLDFAHPVGTPIPSLTDGVVLNKGYSAELGHYIQAGDLEIDKVYTYCHSNEASHLHVGQHVEQGETVTLVGNSGFVTGPHLHLAISDSYRIGYEYAVDPWPYVQAAISETVTLTPEERDTMADGLLIISDNSTPDQGKYLIGGAKGLEHIRTGEALEVLDRVVNKDRLTFTVGQIKLLELYLKK